MENGKNFYPIAFLTYVDNISKVFFLCRTSFNVF